MIGLKTDMVDIVPFDITWKDEFMQEKLMLETILNGYNIDIQHVGSTSITDCPAKPVIDVAIGIPDLVYGEQLVPLLVSQGYIYKGDDGIPGRHYFKKVYNGLTTHHIHMSPIGTVIWNNHILFRDYMLTHPNELEEYISLKKKLAIIFPEDRDSYSKAKSSFIEQIILKCYAMQNENFSIQRIKK